jgi:hypothetical protein
VRRSTRGPTQELLTRQVATRVPSKASAPGCRISRRRLGERICRLHDNGRHIDVDYGLT